MSGYRAMMDTNMVSELIKNPAGRVAARIRDHGDADLCVSVIAAAELRYGAHRKNSKRLWHRINALLNQINVIPFESPADETYAVIRDELTRAGHIIGPNDLLIAAHAHTLGLTLVTANVAGFRRVRGLKIENWLD